MKSGTSVSSNDRRSSRSRRLSFTRKSATDKHLDAIHELEQEQEVISIFPRDIVNDIVDVACDQIHQRYMERQTVRFVVHCAHQALSRLISTHFYRHNDYQRDPEYWAPDPPLLPSSPDSWCPNQVPICRRMEMDSRLNTIEHLRETMGPFITDDLDLDTSSWASCSSLWEDVEHLLEFIIEMVPLMVESRMEVEQSPSAFTLVARGEEDYRNHDISALHSRISLALPKIRVHKVEVPDTGDSQKRLSVTSATTLAKLPPIRTCAKYKWRLHSPRSTRRVKPRDKMSSSSGKKKHKGASRSKL